MLPLLVSCGTYSQSVTKTISTYTDLPKATRDCTAEECAWWERLRVAGNRLMANEGDKNRRAYVQLFVEGIQRGYRVPLSDQPAKALSFVRPTASGKGTVELDLEIRDDSSIGEILVTKGAGRDLDQACVIAASQTIFLPAIKDRKFVLSRTTSKFTFMRPGPSR